MISFFLCCDKQIFYDFYGTKRFRGQFPRDIVLLKSSMKIYLLNIGEILKSNIQKLLSKASTYTFSLRKKWRPLEVQLRRGHSYLTLAFYTII